ncbi:hypothetical protein [Pectinatus frisingensis]|uniref:hypothetical protein n=1 Tax=Pectinatus frisingensis TaxID=865 RepID=UPI001E5128BF|nr:hypothetical protein [Pectinatus frisingensis]
MDVDIKGDTVKNNLLRKRIQLLEENAKHPHILRTSGGEQLLSSSNAEPPLLKNRSDSVSALIEQIEKNKDAINDAYFKKDPVDTNDIASINSNGEQIKNIAANGQQNVQEAIVNPLTVENNDLPAAQLSKPTAADTNKSDPKLNGDITADIIFELNAKNDYEKFIIKNINDTFSELAKRLPEYKKMEQNGAMGFGTAASGLNIKLSWIAININYYNASYNDPSFFDTVIDSLQAAKKSLFTDPAVKNDSEKMSVVGTTKLIDYITDMFKQGKEGTVLSEGSYWEDSQDILSNEFGGDSGDSLATIDDKALSWKYEEYKKRLTAELDNKSHSDNYSLLISDLQNAKNDNDSNKYLKDLTGMLYKA